MNKWMLSIAIGAVSLVAGATANAAVISFADFSSTAGLTLNGTAAGNVNNGIDASPVLRLTSANTSQAGSAFTDNLVGISTFSTMFNFRISNPGNGGADGITFTVQSVGNTQLGGGGGGLGYLGIGQSIAVEFDTWFNGGVDPDANHIGIDLNGSVGSVVTTAAGASLEGGALWTAWVDYDGTTLEVSANTTGVKPGAAMLSHAVDIPSVLLGNLGYVGFTGATGGATSNHDIVSWDFRSADVPEPASVALLGLGLLGLGFRRRKAG